MYIHTWQYELFLLVTFRMLIIVLAGPFNQLWGKRKTFNLGDQGWVCRSFWACSARAAACAVKQWAWSTSWCCSSTHAHMDRRWKAGLVLGTLARVWACEAFRAYRARVATCRVEQWARSASLPLSSAMRTHTTHTSTWPGHMCTCGAEHDSDTYS